MMALEKVPTILLPKRISHSKLDAFLMEKLGSQLPYKINWGGENNEEVESIEYQFEEGSEYTREDVEQAFKSARLEDGEPDEWDAHREAKAEAEREREGAKGLLQRVTSAENRLSAVEELLKTLTEGKR